MTIGDRIRSWDEAMEGRGSLDEDARKPFDAGIMLAVATVLDRWETGDLAGAMRDLQETAEAVIYADVTPRCDLCLEPADEEGPSDWNGETGNHLTCEQWQQSLRPATGGWT